MRNLAPLQLNTLAGFSETAGALYLDLLDKFEGWADRTGERKAFWTACRYEQECGEALDYILRENPVHDLDARTMSDLSQFFAARWRNNFMTRAE